MMWLEHIISTIAPHLCVGCGREDALLCSACALRLQGACSCCYRCGSPTSSRRICVSCRPQSPLYALHAPAQYVGTAKQLVHKLKFGRASAAADAIARQIVSTLIPGRYELILHVPTANTRVRQRGYDQAALIAKRLASLYGLPYYPLLWRIGAQRQLGKSRAVRRQQLQSSFRVPAPAKLQGRQILIVDDVLTTGSTLEAAARVLLEAGARCVSAAVFTVAPCERRKLTQGGRKRL